MKKIILYILTIIFITWCGTTVFKEKNETDALKFKEEYESVSTKDSININNNIVYLNEEEVTKLLDEGTGIMLFASPNDTDSVNVMPSLIEVTNTISMNVYYYNTDNGLNNQNLNKLKDYANNNIVNTPLILFVKKGKIVDDINGYDNNNEVFKNQILNKYLKLT